LAEPLNNSIIELLSTEYRVSEAGHVGAGGKEIWKFRAMDQGKTIISMKYIRPWEKDIPPVKNVQFRVVIYD
jgi:inhibitor of cysteine peptidase